MTVAGGDEFLRGILVYSRRDGEPKTTAAPSTPTRRTGTPMLFWPPGSGSLTMSTS
ncbi:hypothetical protein IUJ34_18105 [Klebsiella pneumoniae subsp. pneumoniae]|uniref:Uncharacterized protein n=1 Tax=Klebsiella pneumoniae subsp. pneumoniae TaxID=72407 RepID=A0A7S9E0U4_KLEPN|nr:hypothetical protein IUJ34_18105 [Klebsiella pneumoniae subsp. pneumoniae]